MEDLRFLKVYEKVESLNLTGVDQILDEFKLDNPDIVEKLSLTMAGQYVGTAIPEVVSKYTLLPGRRCESNEIVSKIGFAIGHLLEYPYTSGEIRNVPSWEISGFLVPVTK
jgi:hypothetical protein